MNGKVWAEAGDCNPPGGLSLRKAPTHPPDT